jgi:Tfp pilus assembly protein PilN
MLHTNLSTRPFYNARAVQTVLGVLALIVLAVTLFNVAQIVRLTLQQRSLSARAVQAERDAQRLRSEAVVIRGRIDPKELTIVAGQAREANAIIDQRTFSWTELFETFEATLPADVRITSVQPRLDQGGTFYVGMTVEARRAEDVDAFVEALEKTGTFHDVLPNEEQPNEEGLLEAVIDGVYVAPSHDTPKPAAAAPTVNPGGAR